MPAASEPREKILHHARERFFREGFAKISVDELTSDLSMSKKTFYQAFGSKDDLLKEIVHRKLAEINSAMDAILLSEKDFLHKFQDFIAYIGNFFSTTSKVMLADMQKHQPQLWQRIEKFRRERLTKNMTSFLDQGMREGFIRKDVNGRVFVLAILGSIDSIMQPTVLMHESFSSNEAFEAIMDVFFKGILTETGRTQFKKIQHHRTTSRKASS